MKIRIRIHYGSISQRHGSADPDPHQNVMDPEHWLYSSIVHLNVCAALVVALDFCRDPLCSPFPFPSHQR
jgi:hypothetical protein